MTENKPPPIREGFIDRVKQRLSSFEALRLEAERADPAAALQLERSLATRRESRSVTCARFGNAAFLLEDTEGSAKSTEESFV